MVIASLSASDSNVTFRYNGCSLRCLAFNAGYVILNPLGGVLATVIIVSLVLKFPAVSLTLAVKFITSPLVTLIVTFWENFPEVPVNVVRSEERRVGKE